MLSIIDAALIAQTTFAFRSFSFFLSRSSFLNSFGFHQSESRKKKPERATKEFSQKSRIAEHLQSSTESVEVEFAIQWKSNNFDSSISKHG
jgi:hypothetical protein